MGGKRQGEAWRRPDYLRGHCGAARVYLLRCYAKNVKTDLTVDEKRQLRQLAAHLKGAQ